MKEYLKPLFSIEGAYLFFMFLFAACATKWTGMKALDVKNIEQFSTSAIFTIYLAYKYKINFSSNIIVFFITLTFWYISLVCFKGQYFEITAIFYLLFVVWTGYVLVNALREKLFVYYERLVVVLSAITLLFYSFQVIIGSEALNRLSFMEPLDHNSIGSFLIYNISNEEVYEGQSILNLPRNCGFCWEPGRFACLVIIAITLNLIRTKAKFVENKPLIILIISLLTTFSTTGYATLLMVIMSFLIMTASNFRKVLFGVCFVPLALFMIDLPFMREKIQDTSDTSSFGYLNESSLAAKEKNVEEEDMSVFTPQRFECISLDVLNFINDPILGYGTNRRNSYVYNEISPYIALSNGIMKDFAMFGIMLAIVFHILLIRNSRYVSEYGKNGNQYIFYIMYLCISVSYSFILLPVVTPIFLYSTLINNKNEQNKHI